MDAVEYYKANGEASTLIEFGISKSMLNDWRHKEDKLRETEKTRRVFRGGRISCPEFETRLLDWVNEKRSKNRAVQIRDLQIKALNVAKDYSNGFCERLNFEQSVRRLAAFQNPKVTF